MQTKVINCNIANKSCLLQLVHTKAIAASTQFCDFYDIYSFVLKQFWHEFKHQIWVATFWMLSFVRGCNYSYLSNSIFEFRCSIENVPNIKILQFKTLRCYIKTTDIYTSKSHKWLPGGLPQWPWPRASNTLKMALSSCYPAITCGPAP